MAIKSRIMSIKFDESGVENTLRAVDYTLKNFSGKQWRLFVAAVTDEAGDDTGRKAGDSGDKNLNRIANMLKATKTRFYVFGCEAGFSYGRKWTPIYDLDGRIVDYNWSDAGTETPEPELLPFQWRFNNCIHTIDSGFGIWTLSFMSYVSDGKYFILSDAPSPYDEDRLGKYFAPEMIPRLEYVRRRKASKIRRTMHFITTEWAKKMAIATWLTHLDRLNEDAIANIKKAREAYEWIRRARRELSRTSPKDRYRPQRWKANKDLTLAQLAKHQFQLRQYWIALEGVLRNGWPYPKKGEQYTHFSVNFASPTEKPPGGRIARKELREARKLLQQVAEEYKELPWGALAAKDLHYLRPFVVRWGYYVSHERRKQ